MAKACIIKNKKTGEIERVTAANGKNSILYQGLVTLLGNQEMALLAWAKTYTKEFKDWFGDSKAVDKNGEPLLLYLDSNNTDNNVFKFIEEKNNQPVFVKSDEFEFANQGIVYETTDSDNIKQLLNVVPEIKEIDFNIVEGNEVYEKIAFQTKDAHTRLKDFKTSQKKYS